MGKDQTLVKDGYLSSPQVMDCPADTTRTMGDPGGSDTKPSWTKGNNRSCVFERTAGFFNSKTSTPKWFPPYSPDQDPAPSEDQLIFDFESGNFDTNSQSYRWGYERLVFAWGDFVNWGYAGLHHQGVINIAAADGHVETYQVKGAVYAASDKAWPVAVYSN